MTRAPLSTAVLSPVKRIEWPLERALDYWNDPIWTEDQQAWVMNMIQFADGVQSVHDSSPQHPVITTDNITTSRLLWEQTSYPIDSNTERVTFSTADHLISQEGDSTTPFVSTTPCSPFGIRRERPGVEKCMSSQDQQPLVSALGERRGCKTNPGGPTCTICGRQRSKCEHAALQNLMKAGLIISSPNLNLGISYKPEKSSDSNNTATLLNTSQATETTSMADLTDMQWQLCEIPSELHQTEDNLPQLIKSIVEEFWQESLAIQASARGLKEQDEVRKTELQASASTTRGQIENAQGDSKSLDRSSSPNSPSNPKSLLKPLELSPSATSASISKQLVESPTTDAAKHKQSSSHVSPFLNCLISKFRKGKQALRPGVADVDEFKECASCFDEILSTSSIHLSCQHDYCKACFADLITTAMQTENLWPPRCCMIDVPRPMILIHLSNKQVLEFGAKEKEYGTPANERWYCTNPRCLKFFEPSRNGDWTECTQCKFQICWYCRGERHTGQKWQCSQDKDLKATVHIAELEGWRKCYKCGQMVELNTGCTHITCTCKAQWCYTCGAAWKTCFCEPTDEARRQQRLADARAIEAATQAAAEAAAERKRKDRHANEQQLLAEKRELEEAEAKRLAGIQSYYREMYRHLQSVQETQARAVAIRHAGSLFAIDRTLSDLRHQKRHHEQSHPSLEPGHIKNIRDEYERELKRELEADHYTQKHWLESYGPYGKDPDPIVRNENFQRLLDEQRKTRDARAARFARDIEVAEKNLRNADNELYEIAYKKRLTRLHRDVARATQKLEDLRQEIAFEDKWVAFSTTELPSLLEEDRIHFTKSGAYAPGEQMESPVSKDKDKLKKRKDKSGKEKDRLEKAKLEEDTKRVRGAMQSTGFLPSPMGISPVRNTGWPAESSAMGAARNHRQRPTTPRSPKERSWRTDW